VLFRSVEIVDHKRFNGRARLNAGVAGPVVLETHAPGAVNEFDAPENFSAVDVVASNSAKSFTLDKNELDVDLLAFKDLDQNSLDDKKEIDRNDLEIDLLSLAETDELSAQNKTALGDAFQKNILPNYNPASNIGYYFNDDKSKITLYRRPDHVAEVTVGTDQNAVVNINQGGTAVKQQVNSGGTTVISITQK
jgi:hypothetical protein